jgi:hypothetical protein
MSSFLRIIVTGLIAQDSLTGGFLEHGLIKLKEDRPTTIGLPRTAPSTLPVYNAFAWEAAIIARSSRSVVQYFGQPAEADPELC